MQLIYTFRDYSLIVNKFNYSIVALRRVKIMVIFITNYDAVTWNLFSGFFMHTQKGAGNIVPAPFPRSYCILCN